MLNYQKLTAAEEQIMLTVWSLGEFYFKDLLEALPDPKPHQNTVSTYLKILKEKDFINFKKEGRIYKYHFVIAKNEYRSFLVKNLVESFFDGSEDLLLKEFGYDNDVAENVKNEAQTPIATLIDELTTSKAKGDKKKKKKKDKKKK